MRRMLENGSTRRVLTCLAAALLALSAVGLSSCSADAPRPVKFEGTDGVSLGGHLFGKGDVGILLAHMYPADQKSWYPMARKLAAKGYLVMTFDFRGYGESGGEKVIAEIDRDLEGAYRFLRPQVRRIVLMGASMGGTASIIVASRHPVAGVVSLSGPMAFRGLDARKAIHGVKAPCLFIAAEGDRYAAGAARWFHDEAKGPKGLLIVPGGEHGTRLFDGPKGKKVEETIFQFLGRFAGP